MYEVEWSNRKLWKQQEAYTCEYKSQLDINNIRSTALLRWEEHCLECAVPDCYRSCELYVQRSDYACSRFVYGIYPNRDFKGIFGWGSDILFRPWAKLETGLYMRPVSVRMHRLIHIFDTFSSALIRTILSVMPKRVSYGIHWRFTGIRHRILAALSTKDKSCWNTFVLECFSPGTDSFRLIMECNGTKTQYRHSFMIKPGYNYHTVPARQLGFAHDDQPNRLTIYPENDGEKRIIFTCLDLVEWKSGTEKTIERDESLRPAEKVKCIAWDLDNTLWKGTLIEDGQDNIEERADAIEAIKHLDERGIINTIVSKNNYDEAWAVINRLGLQEYFVFPAINWANKSNNIRQIADRLNVGIDTFALVDDSPFERAEVEESLPQVRVYSDQAIKHILTFPEFDVPVTEMSKKRRLSYLTQVQRESAKESFRDDYVAFLQSCQMKINLFVPQEESHIARCWELIQRSNQLNLSIRRYSNDEFTELRRTEGMLCVAIDCSDRFGDYGIVGFTSVDERGPTVHLVDFVISCRVAQKRLEHAFLQWLSERESRKGKNLLEVKLVRTKKNSPLMDVFENLPFNIKEENENYILMDLPLDEALADDDIIEVIDRIEG